MACLQGGPSGHWTLECVDIKSKVPQAYKLLILRRNSYSNANQRFSTTRWTTLYLKHIYPTCCSSSSCSTQDPSQWSVRRSVPRHWQSSAHWSHCSRVPCMHSSLKGRFSIVLCSVPHFYSLHHPLSREILLGISDMFGWPEGWYCSYCAAQWPGSVSLISRPCR